MTNQEKIDKLQDDIQQEKAFLDPIQQQEIEDQRTLFEQEAEQACEFGMARAKKKDKKKACEDAVNMTKFKYMKIELETLKSYNEQK